MEKKITLKEDSHPLVNNKIAKRVYGLLFKKEMSIKELAQKIYGKKGNRNEITKWIKYFKQKGWIDQVHSLELIKEKKYSSNLNPFFENSEFNDSEKKFIQIFTKRFWNADRSNIPEGFSEILIEAIIIKQISKIKPRLVGYNPQKDREKYNKAKRKFWEDENFRNYFLDKIRESSKRRDNSMKPSIVRDFLFMSLLIPDSILNKIGVRFRIVGDPLSTIMTLLKE